MYDNQLTLRTLATLQLLPAEIKNLLFELLFSKIMFTTLLEKNTQLAVITRAITPVLIIQFIIMKKPETASR